jgi:hypothetical protein
MGLHLDACQLAVPGEGEFGDVGWIFRVGHGQGELLSGLHRLSKIGDRCSRELGFGQS